MTAPNESDDKLLEAIQSGRVEPGSSDPSLAKALAAHQKLEALFELLRGPAQQEQSDVATLVTSVGTQSSSGLRFRILRPHAKGGLGEVFVALDEELHREVALKEIQGRFADHPESRSRFVLEAEITGGLEHPGIVPVYGLGQYGDGRPFYAMRFIRGDSLKDAIERFHRAESPGRDPGERTLALRKLLGRFLDVCNAVAYAHSRGVLHRDLKPGNIMLGQYGETLVVDWGLAKPLDRLEGAAGVAQSPLKPASGSGVTPTQMGSALGTPQYMSPEQAAGRLDLLGTATDVYSLGATLYSLLTGKPPFDERDLGVVLQKVQKGDFIPPRKINPSVHPALEAICLKAMALTPQGRYASPRVLADDIEHWLADEPVSAWREPLTVRARRWVGRHRTKLAAAVAALLVATVSFALATALLTAAYEHEREAKELALKQEEQARFARHVDTGDAALFRCLTGQRPTWLPAVIETHRQQGIDAYSAALEINSNAVWPLVQRGRLYANKRQSLELALADFDQAHQDRPGYASIQKFRGHVLKRLGREEEAQAAFEKARNLYPTTAEDLYWLGNIAHSKEQDLAAAHSYFTQALLLSPDHYWSRLERAEWGQPAGGPSESDSRRRIAEFTTVKILRPDIPFASESLFVWQKTVQTNSRQELQEQIDRFGLNILRAHDMAGILEKEGKSDEAETLLRKVLDQDTGGWTAEMIGRLKHRLGKYAEAIDWYQRAMKEGKKDTSLYLKIAYAFTVLQDFQAAEQTYRRGIAEDPNDPMLFYELASWYEARGKLPEAEETYKAGCQLPVQFKKTSDADELPETGDNTGTLKVCYQNYALLLEKSGRKQEMISLLERAIERLEKAHAANSKSAKGIVRPFPDVGFLKNLLAQQYIYAGRRKDVMSLIDAELKTKPLGIEQADMVVSLLRSLGMKEQALDVARIAEFAVRDDRWGRFAASNLVDGQLQELGSYRELVERIETRRALGDSLNATDYSILGTWYTDDQALGIYNEAIARHPKSFRLQTDYMSLLTKLGRKEDARKAYETARDLFFEAVATSSRPAPPSLLLEGDQLQSRHPWPATAAMPWFSYLMEQGSLDELNGLEGRLRDASVKLGKNPDELLLARARAEVNTGRYPDAVKSLKACLTLKQGNEAWVVPMLAHSLLNLNERREALPWLRRAVELTDYDPAVLSKFLFTLVQEQGVTGLSKELSDYKPLNSRLNVRLNATITSFDAWESLRNGNEREALTKAVKAGVYLVLAIKEGSRGSEEEILICAAMLHAVAEKLGDKERMTAASQILMLYPPSRVKAIQKELALPK